MRHCRGLGYRGVYLGGHIGAEEYGRILELAAQYAADDWRDFARQIRYSRPGEFFYFAEDPDTGLASTQINQAYLDSKTPGGRRRAPLTYRINRQVHDRVFEPGKALFRLGASLARKVEDAANCKSLFTPQSTRSKSPLLTAATAAIARCRTSPTCARNRSASKTSATAPAAARAKASAKSATRTVFGRARTTASRPTAKRNKCSATQPSSRMRLYRAPVLGLTPFCKEITTARRKIRNKTEIIDHPATSRENSSDDTPPTISALPMGSSAWSPQVAAASCRNRP